MKSFCLGEIEKESALLLNTEQVEYFQAIIIKEESEKLWIGLKNPDDFKYHDFFKKHFEGKVLEFGRISEEDFKKALSWLKLEERLIKLLSQIFDEIQKISEGENSSILELVTLILQEGVSKRASDIHFQKDFEQCRICFRIDGVLIERFNFQGWVFAPLSSSLKLLANLNITENTMPQDGRFSLELLKEDSKRLLDFRVSVLPLMDGESIVLRVLDKQKTLLSLESLGFLPIQMEKIRRLFSLPYGLVFITGPTGSGKSTTMYGILNIIKDRNLKIITLEDPIEYRLPRIAQVAVGQKMSFASILKNVLRQDPDVIILGEVRDRETLQIAIQAAFTGHLVFATLHTNDSLDTIVRLLDMGLEPYFIAQSLSGIIAQRLVRKLCVCKVLEGDSFVSKGCVICNNTGYNGREVIAEVVEMDKVLEDFIYQKIDKQRALDLLRERDLDFSLYQQGLKKVELGITDLKEVYRVVK
ncbi:GspE/PulE family protein [Helicobacter mesocricetorum]|uniref:GspE/PulE family protein n=1 Tax=Helicobacter mesocricetorum TaxID=87012 RepID=UPI000CF01E2A|nr:GspE/PulE family protein [Helicobacter mesocricetorum]